MRSVLIWILLLVILPTFSWSQGNKTLEDSLYGFVKKKEKNQYWRSLQVVSNEQVSDSFKLKMYELQYECYLNNEIGDFKNKEWIAVQALVNQGIVLEHMGADSSIVLSRFRMAYELAAGGQMKTSMLWSSIRIAKHYLNIGVLNTKEEIYHYSMVDSLVKNPKLHPETRYLGYHYLGNRHLRYNDYSIAFEYYYKAYEMAKLQEDVELIVKLGNNLILITENTGDTTGNNLLLNELIHLIPEDDYYHLALYYTNLAGYDFLDEDDKRIIYLKEALRNYNMSNNKDHIVTLYMLLSDFYYEQKNADSTLFYNLKIRKTLASLPPTQMYYDDIFAGIYEGKYQLLIGNYEGAISKMKNALQMAKEKKAFLVVPGIYESMYQFAQAEGDYEMAFIYLNQFKSIQDSLNSIERQKQYQNLFVKFETEEKQKTIHTLQKEQALSEELIDEHRKNNQILVASLTLLTFMLSVVVYFFISNQRKSKKLIILNELKDKVFSVLSHDLRTPLNTFNGLIEIGKRKSISPDDYKRYLNMIQHEVCLWGLGPFWPLARRS